MMHVTPYLLPERWPPPAAFTDLRQSVQFTDGKVRCVAIAIRNDSGEDKTVFLQGERANFFAEFEIIQDIQVPAVGLSLLSESGRVIHSRNTFQYPAPVPCSVRAGSVLRQYQSVALRISPGKYDFGVGLAGTDPESYEGYANGNLSHLDFNKNVREHCRVVRAGSLEVGWAANGKLSHHGMADLPGSASLEVIENGGLQPAAKIQPDPMPPVFHVTHWKAGSQWIYRILRQCVPDKIVEPRPGESQVRHYPIQRGRVYPTVYMTRQDLAKVAPSDAKRFVVIRDLRDTLISAYFSMKHSHSLIDEEMVAMRKKLNELDQEAGLLHLLDDVVAQSAKIQLSWIVAGEPILKYEELLENDLEQLERVLIGQCGLPIQPEDLRKAVLESRFESVTQGRRRGCQEILSHERKGIAGDWKNHFTGRVKDAFKAYYGGVLVAAEYEKDLKW